MNTNPNPSPPARCPKKTAVSATIRQEIVRLHAYYGSREISLRMALSRKIVRRILREEGSLTAPPQAPAGSKLEAFKPTIKEKLAEGLTVSRILREIRSQGYQGGRSILAVYAAGLQTSPPANKCVKRRFETSPGVEMQIDWSPFHLNIAGVTRLVYAFACLLCSSRKLWVHFYRNERQSTLLEALASAFDYFCGCALHLLLDNMATAVLGRWGPKGQPVWHPRFLEFARHYGFTPVACAVRDPDRKGRVEKSFRLLSDDFLKSSRFESLEDLNARAAVWLDETPEVGNQRLHGTTRTVPNIAWQAEKPLLIQLPDSRFPTFQQDIRVVDQDSTLSLEGTRYTVPSALACRSVAVRLYAEHFEVLDAHHHILFSRRYAGEAEKGKLLIDPTHYATLPKRRPSGTTRLDQAFLARFPALQPFVSGLQLRMKNLTPVHLRALLRLLDSYGEPTFLQAVLRAQQFHRYDSHAVKRILQQLDPLAELPPVSPRGAIGPVLLDGIEPGCLDDYGSLDLQHDTPEEDSHGA
jgi:transposase